MTVKLPLEVITRSGVAFVGDAEGHALYANADTSTALVMAGQLAGNQTYRRGLKTERVKTARLVPGQQVLTWSTSASTPADPRKVEAAQQKTYSVIRTVDKLEATRTAPSGLYGRAGRVYTVWFTDGTFSANNAPIYTWHAVSGTAPQEV